MPDNKTASSTISMASLPVHFISLADNNLLSVIPCDFIEDTLAICKEALSDKMFLSINKLIKASVLSDRETTTYEGEEIATYIVKTDFIQAVMLMIKQLISSEASDTIRSHSKNILIPITTTYEGEDYESR